MNAVNLTEHMLKTFKKSLYEAERSPITISKYLHDVEVFMRFADKRAVDKTIITEYKLFLKNKYALTSANSMLAALNAFFRYHGKYELCTKQFRVQKPIFCSEKKELSKKEYFALLAVAEKKKRARISLVMQTICSTGIRVSELEFVTVEAAKRGEMTVSCKAKTRIVFLPAALQKKLLRYAKAKNIQGGGIFVTKNGKPLNRSNIWQEMKLLCKEAGVIAEKVFPHNLRHLFARVFYKMEKDMAKLADILGHSSINTTRIYIVSSGAEHRRKMEHMRLLI